MHRALSRSSRELAAPLWGMVAAVACAAMAPLEPNLVEEGLLVHVAQRIVAGDHLYRDVFALTGPFPYELLATLFRVFGEEIAVARGAVVVLTGLSGAAAFALARRAGCGAMAHVGAAVVVSTPILLFPLLSIYFYTTLVVHLGLIGAYAAVRGTRSLRWAVVAGAIVGCAALCKQTVGGLLAIALLAAMTACTPAGRRRPQFLAMAGGGFAVALVTLGIFALRGDLEALIHSLVVLPFTLEKSFASAYMNFWPLGSFGAGVRANQAFYLPFHYALAFGPYGDVAWPMVLLTQLLYALPWIAIAVTITSRFREPLSPAIWIHGAVLLAMVVNLFPRADWGHLVFVLPAAAFQLVLVQGARTHRPREWILSPRWAAGALVALLLVGSGTAGVWVWQVSVPSTFGPRVPQRPVSEGHRDPGVPRVIDYLRRRVEPGEAIFVARAEPLIYFATGTRNPTPFEGVITGVHEEQEREILKALESVRYVVMSDVDQPLMTYYREELPAVQDYLERHFHVPSEFDVVEGDWIVVMERGVDRGSTAIDLIAARATASPWVRDRAGGESPAPNFVPRLATRHNRRPLPVILGIGGGGVDFELEIPDRAVFQADVGWRYAIGEHRRWEQPRRARLTVAIREDGRWKTLKTVRALYREGTPARWTPVEVDLAEYAGQRVTLRLVVIPDRPLEGGALAWWGSPRIAVRAATD